MSNTTGKPTNSTWNYRDSVTLPEESIVGYDVVASDGSIGTVEAASHDPDDSYLVVDIGFWIFGKQRMVPAAAVRQINPGARKVFLSVDKKAIKHAPDHDGTERDDPATRDQRAVDLIGPKF